MGHSNLIKVIENPILLQLLTELRDRNTDCTRFREILNLMGMLLAYEISKSFETEKIKVRTPLNVDADGFKLKDFDNIVLVAVLRASVPMINGAAMIYEKAKIGFISAKRIEGVMSENLEMEVRVDYSNLPNVDGKVVIVMDPMLATGSTLIRILEKIFENGKPKKVIIVSVIATEQGASRIIKKFADVDLYTVAVDKKLNSRGYIVPGLGDAGDRAFDC